VKSQSMPCESRSLPGAAAGDPEPGKSASSDQVETLSELSEAPDLSQGGPTSPDCVTLPNVLSRCGAPRAFSRTGDPGAFPKNVVRTTRGLDTRGHFICTCSRVRI
jgi:hypothetical protein